MNQLQYWEIGDNVSIKGTDGKEKWFVYRILNSDEIYVIDNDKLVERRTIKQLKNNSLDKRLKWLLLNL